MALLLLLKEETLNSLVSCC